MALTFFTELSVASLSVMLSDGAVLDALGRMSAGVAVALIDLSDDRARLIRVFNERGIRVHGWLVLPRAHGYYFNLDNAPAALARYEETHAWVQRHGLKLDAIGLDIEPDLRLAHRFFERPVRTSIECVRRAFDGDRLGAARATYERLVAKARADGYRVESYQFPPIVDERRARSRVLQRVSGVLDLGVDREVLMLYTTLMVPRGPAPLLSYARDAQAIAVGSTGGGLDDQPKLSFEMLKRDLLLARQFTEDLYVFSLEGCWENDHLDRLASLDWTQRPAAPKSRALAFSAARATARLVLRAIERVTSPSPQTGRGRG